jgi:hypothetical protein
MSFILIQWKEKIIIKITKHKKIKIKLNPKIHQEPSITIDKFLNNVKENVTKCTIEYKKRGINSNTNKALSTLKRM